MNLVRLQISNFRGIRSADLLLPQHAVLVGDSNTGKTTLLEAVDLVLGPDRLSRRPPIDEHDFFQGLYRVNSAAEELTGCTRSDAESDSAEVAPDSEIQVAGSEVTRIEIDVTIVNLGDEQKARFGDYIEFWDSNKEEIYDRPEVSGIDQAHVTEALRVSFHGWYDEEEDDFEGVTYFTRTLSENEQPVTFSRRDKQACGFLYLRSLRTGSRALSLERGSLLDVILRLKEVRPQMWEGVLQRLSSMSVADDPVLGVSPVLESINTALKKYVPKEWGVEPHLKVSNLTREHLRKILTAFIATDDGDHAAPFYRQGAGTINMLVLAMLSQIAEDKGNVIFAMEEPETAIPPYAQKRIVHEVRRLATQALFTSHSPYVIEEFPPEDTVVLTRTADGCLNQRILELPDSVKLKRYRQEFRTRYCEALLSRRVLVAEGATEASAFPVACRRLEEIRPDTYSSLESLGVCTVDVGGDANIPEVAQFYKDLKKSVYALCDKQEKDSKARIMDRVDLLLMHPGRGFESMVLTGTTEDALARFANQIDWPPHLKQKYPDWKVDISNAMRDYFGWAKGNWGIADFLAQCTEEEIPGWLRTAAIELAKKCTSDPTTLGDIQPKSDSDEPD